ncbi:MULTISPECIES: cytochrome-c oxidase, cbb3-type subunit I [Chryseobacterium]|jgi:cytochrome c oxidase cbb3-type subunit I/II|uniref:cytochrome-c oxidase n=2 Tax=Chryseobacterium aquaticum TaxID=452084 RepID=A0A0Q3LU25_9FLAO|nr:MULTISPECIES: cytochrome-c oxidase, cbb3-type subunit I [Chryseobacterium]KNB61985.1 bifunctional cbb3-type cytochrome c oxidase subunit I/II [Chryseobacterium sp. Hurlbut01]KQK26841.1 cytochrome C oxidase Cbb3 [Chryseobacterium aquaticum]KUJ57425.1 cytochrome C oxidase Cbb3 [Chryseobacterium aquaticum subsp. greenlandense]NMR35057.1 cytochrome-c oxidase, cbb3-type subunit I [Chryseobacterium aquaticum]NRQ47079.1 cytochrome-c oxidase, cbb3-type subunit I [Chryseobacterium sp. C-204]
METQKFSYDNSIVRAFLYATIVFGIIGFLFGLTAALMLFYPELPEFLFGTDDTTIKSLSSGDISGLISTNGAFGFGRIRMLHTSTVIFAFVCNIVYVGVYYSTQRLLKTRMYSDTLSWIHFWTWQLMIVATYITFFMGINTSKEYAEHEWPIDILIAISWIIFGINMIMTIKKRRVRHLYVAIWFYLGTWVAVAMLHIFNNLEVPLSFAGWKSYSAYAGAKDAIVQWWYGHNAVAFVLTTPVLGLMYYFLPKAADRPVFSYKLSIIHFWSLIFVYIWAGPHHLQYTALPAWAQAVGTGFSIMLIAPSWGGMLNGLLTLRGAWDKVRENPILKFFVVAVTCYGMATFEGPLLATKNINKIGHFTDWVIGHVHLGALGWNGFMAFGVIYYLVPILWRTKIYSVKLANWHFWLGTLGIIFYAVPMYIAGFTQGLMWKQFNPDGTLLWKNWLDTVTAIIPYYKLRFMGGLFYLSGALLMVVNVYATVRKGSFQKEVPAEAPALANIGNKRKEGEGFHLWLERMPMLLTVLSLLTISIGSMVEIIPTLSLKKSVPVISAVKPYSPLELEGRDLYIREGCNSCHSQMVRPFRDEIVRFNGKNGQYSKAGEFIYDRPFLWGSKRTGPDLHREGGKNPSSWHYKHMYNPRSTSAGSIMPRFPWLIANNLDRSKMVDKITLMKNTFDVPYTKAQIDSADKWADNQAAKIVKDIFSEAADLKAEYAKRPDVKLEDKEIIALIAYLQRLGTDIKTTEIKTASNN